MLYWATQPFSEQLVPHLLRVLAAAGSQLSLFLEIVLLRGADSSKGMPFSWGHPETDM